MPKQGYRISGDCYFKDQIDSVIRYIMIDPLGHGDKASALSQLAVEEIKNLHMVELSQVLAHLSQHFHQTRGLAMSFAFFDHSKQTIQLAIAGNVNIVLLLMGFHINSNKTLKEILFFQGKHTDFTQGWYEDIGC